MTICPQASTGSTLCFVTGAVDKRNRLDPPRSGCARPSWRLRDIVGQVAARTEIAAGRGLVVRVEVEDDDLERTFLPFQDIADLEPDLLDDIVADGARHGNELPIVRVLRRPPGRTASADKALPAEGRSASGPGP